MRGEHIYSPSELTDSITYGDGEYPFTLIALEKLNKEINLNLRRAFKKCYINEDRKDECEWNQFDR